MPSHIARYNTVLQRSAMQQKIEEVVGYGVNAEEFWGQVNSAVLAHVIDPLWNDPDNRHPPEGKMAVPSNAPCHVRF